MSCNIHSSNTQYELPMFEYRFNSTIPHEMITHPQDIQHSLISLHLCMSRVDRRWAVLTSDPAETAPLTKMESQYSYRPNHCIFYTHFGLRCLNSGPRDKVEGQTSFYRDSKFLKVESGQVRFLEIFEHFSVYRLWLFQLWHWYWCLFWV